MRQKLFIHIGPHKTGTSSLQRFLYDNRRALLKLGVCYPAAHLDGYRAQHRLAFSVRQKPDPSDRQVPSREAEISAILNEIKSSGADTAIISSEAFFPAHTTAIQFLHDRLHELTPIVVFYARRQDEGYVSTFTQRAKSPRNRYAQPIHTHLDHPVSMSSDLDIYKHASDWAQIFGKDNVVARLYDRTISVPEDFLRCIDERRKEGPALASMMEHFNVSKEFNKSPSLEATELTRLFKTQCDDLEGRRVVFKLMQKQFANGRSAAKLLSTTDRRVILEFFRPSNEKLFREYFSCENKFAPELLLTGEETGREELTVADTAKMIAELLKIQRPTARGTLQLLTGRAIAATSQWLGFFGRK